MFLCINFVEYIFLGASRTGNYGKEVSSPRKGIRMVHHSIVILVSVDIDFGVHRLRSHANLTSRVHAFWRRFAFGDAKRRAPVFAPNCTEYPRHRLLSFVRRSCLVNNNEDNNKLFDILRPTRSGLCWFNNNNRTFCGIVTLN